MIGRGLFILTILSNCVLSLPVTSSHLENEDVKVMKCIVEALADVLSRPHPLPVSQECLVTLKTDDRLVTLLRHHNFLKELQMIAAQGGQERAQLQDGAAASDHVTHVPQTADDVADQSMLEALGGAGERSILNQKRRMENGDGGEGEDESPRDRESRERNERGGRGQEKREKNESPANHLSDSRSPANHLSDSVSDWSRAKAEKRGENEEEEKRAKLEESSEEEDSKDKTGDESNEKRDAPENKSEEKKSDEDDEEGQKKRSSLFSHDDTRAEREGEEEDDEGALKRARKDSLKLWTKRAKSPSAKKRAGGEEHQQQGALSHHSKEEERRATQEVRELQMIARRSPEERRGLEEEGSGSPKSEEPEIESLAAIESELESVAQKLHEMRRG